VWAGLALFFAFAADNFLSGTTIRAVASEQAVTAIVALGLTVALAAGVFDLSIAGSMGLAAVVVSKLVAESGWPIPLAIIATVLVCSMIGLFNAFLVLKLRIHPFIATLGTQSILVALIYVVSDNKNIVGLPSSFRNLASTQIFSIPIPVFYMLGLALLLWYVMAYTPVGRRLYATGGNVDVARLAGIRTSRYVVGAFLTSAVVAGIGGIIVTARIGTGSPELGPSYLLPAFAAGFLGSTQFRPGRFNAWGTVVAVYLLATGVKGLVLMGADFWVPDLFNGVALITAVGLSNLQRRPPKAEVGE
jgi:ribose transport system permease protein